MSDSAGFRRVARLVAVLAGVLTPWPAHAAASGDSAAAAHSSGAARHAAAFAADSAARAAAAIGVRVASARTSARSDDLSATRRPPWKPARPVPRREPWEQALLLPGRIVSLPLVGLGAASERTLRYGEDHGYLSLTGSPSSSHSFSLGGSHLGDRAGLGGAVEAREPVGSGRGRIDLLARYAATVRDYNGSLVTVAGHPASVQYGYSWRPEERFYGVGPSAPLGRLTGYASQTEWARAMLRFAGADSGLDGRPWSIVEMWGGPRSLVTRRGREPGVESLDAASPQFAPMRDLRVDHFVTGVRAAYDSRTGQPHWGSGTRLAASAERYDAPLAPLALHSARDLGARFIRYQLEGETGVSFRRDPRTLRLLVRLEDQRVLSGADRFAPADFAVLGGNAGLSGFPSGRFHDLDALQGRLSYLFPISRRLELDLHSEWGAVMPDVWRDARLAGLEHSAGFAVRARWERAMLGSLGMDFSREGGRLSYFLGSVR